MAVAKRSISGSQFKSARKESGYVEWMHVVLVVVCTLERLVAVHNDYTEEGNCPSMKAPVVWLHYIYAKQLGNPAGFQPPMERGTTSRRARRIFH